MGTRGFIGFVVDGAEKIAYNHWDSYPSGLGTAVLSWLRDADVDGAAKQARSLRVVDPQSKPTRDDIEHLAKWTDLSVSSRSTDDWYCLLRHTRGNPGAMLEAGVIEDASEFPADSLFAEWGYVVDFDAGSFEVYRGFQEFTHDRGRFAGRSGRGDYQPVALAASFPIAELPDDATFLATVDPGDEG